MKPPQKGATHSLPRPSFYRAAWHLLIIAAILLAPSYIVFATPFWELSRVDLWLTLGTAVAYVAAVVALAAPIEAGAVGRALIPVGAGAVIMCAVFGAMLLADTPDHSRRLLIFGSSLAAVGILATPWSPRSPGRFMQMAAGLFALVGIIAAGNLLSQRGKVEGPEQRTQTIQASQHILSATYYSGIFPAQEDIIIRGGAITPDPTGEGYFLARPRGELYHVSFDENGRLHTEDLRLRVPSNYREFDADVGENVERASFRVADILAERRGEATRIYASHHHWKRSDRCFVVRVSSITLPRSGQPSEPAGPEWKTEFESSPCLQIAPARGAAFAGEQLGGNLEKLGEGKILITVGDHQFDGWYRPSNLVDDPEADYGKTVLIDTETGETSVFTTGHRNPQGLVVDSLGRIWSTEHGPQGGDELNLLKRGGDYGYPQHTYGTEYGVTVWPPGENAEKDGSGVDIKPVFAWVPSIGISEVVEVVDPAFDRWKGDLLVASLVGRALWRTRVVDGRVVYSEPIEFGERLRDVAVEAGTGEIVLWTDSESIIRVRPAEGLNQGSVLFAMRCGGCHDDIEHRIGPNLMGIFEREVASAEGYQYSSALREVGGRWTDDRMDEFLADPRSFAPGTTMAIEGEQDPAARERIIDYLHSFYQ